MVQATVQKEINQTQKQQQIGDPTDKMHPQQSDPWRQKVEGSCQELGRGRRGGVPDVKMRRFWGDGC